MELHPTEQRRRGRRSKPEWDIGSIHGQKPKPRGSAVSTGAEDSVEWWVQERCTSFKNQIAGEGRHGSEHCAQRWQGGLQVCGVCCSVCQEEDLLQHQPGISCRMCVI